MTFRHDDERRQQMARAGFTVRQIDVDRKTREVVTVWYQYDPEECAEWMQRVTGADGDASTAPSHSSSSRASA